MNNAIFEILRTGIFNGGKGLTLVSPEHLAQLSSLYTPEHHKAPLVIGHPEDDKPEFGSVTRLYSKGNRLFAEAEVSTELVKKIKNKEISGISAAFYYKNTPNNPLQGLSPYLKHVGFLEKGVQEPAVKGMLPPEISVSHIAELNENETFVFLNAGGNTETNMNSLDEKANYFSAVLGIEYKDAVNMIQGRK